MPERFITSNRLVTLAELRYLLLDVLDPKITIQKNELSRLCKEHSFNFAFAFENTLDFLQILSLVKINDDNLITRSPEINIDALDVDYNLKSLILEKTFSHLKDNGLFQKIINEKTISTDSVSNQAIIHTDKIPLEFPFIKVLLLNLRVAEFTRSSNDHLLILKEYNSFFTVNPQGSPPVVSGIPNHNLPDSNMPIVKKPAFFISYAHKDEEYKEELRKHMSGLIRNDSMDQWNGRAILPGEDWDDEVRKKLEEAQVVLFLVSADFIDSDYIHDVEIAKTIERHNKGLVKIIPVIIRACDFKSLPISKYQALPVGEIPITSWANRDEAYKNVVDQIKRIIKKK